MDDSRTYYTLGGQGQTQSNSVDEANEDSRQDKAVDDMVKYVRQVGKLNQANRQLVAGIERSKFKQVS